MTAKNTVSLIGRLTKNPELRHTQKNVPAVQFTLAVEQNYKGQDGKRGADFPSCVCYNKPAEFMSTYLRKGDLISINGEIRTRTYVNKDGITVFHTEVIARDVSPLESKMQRERRNGPIEAPLAEPTPEPKPPMGVDVPIEEDVPF